MLYVDAMCGFISSIEIILLLMMKFLFVTLKNET